MIRQSVVEPLASIITHSHGGISGPIRSADGK
jgi:hypothetical protein